MNKTLIAKAWEQTLHQISLGWFREEDSKTELKPVKPLDAIIYDCEIIKMIRIEGEYQEEELEYCGGWDDHENMGISVIGCYDYMKDRYRVFLEDNFDDFVELANSRKGIIGFNSISFDDELCNANGLQISTTYDLLCEVRIASGQPPHYTRGKTRGGYSLERLAQANLGYGKSGSGELAPKLWQQEKHGAVIDYCLGDISITKKLFDNRLNLIDPTNGETLRCRENPMLPEEQETEIDDIPF